MMAILVLALGVGMAAGPGEHGNLTTALLWLAWFPLFIYFSVAVAGDVWCRGCCPLPAVFRVVGPGRARRLPAWLAGGLPAALGFIVVVRWVAPHFDVSASPFLTAWFFLAWVVAGVLMARRYAAASFCGAACPTGAMVRLYSRASVPALVATWRGRRLPASLNTAEAVLSVAALGIFSVAMTLHHRWAPASLHRAAEALRVTAGLSHARAMFDVTFLAGLVSAFAGFALVTLVAGRLARVGFGQAFRSLAPALVPVSLFSGLSHSVHVLLTQAGNAASAVLTQMGVAVYLSPALVPPPVAEMLDARGTGPLWWLTAAGYGIGLFLAWRGAADMVGPAGPSGRVRWRLLAAFAPVALGLVALFLFREYAAVRAVMDGGMVH